MKQELTPLPHSAESERALLGSILLSPEKIDLIRSMIPTPEPIYIERHKLIYGAFLALHDDGDGIDLRTLQARLERSGDFERVGGLAYLAALDLDLPLCDLSSVSRYCAIVVERWTRRRLIEWGSVAAERGRSGAPAAESLEQIQAALNELSVGLAAVGARPVTLESALLDYDPREDLSARLGIPTGFADIDHMSGGLRPGELTVLAASPSAGKSALALQAAAHVAASSRRVLYCMLEDRIQDAMMRILSQGSSVTHDAIRRGALVGAQADEIDALVDRSLMAASRLQISTTPGVTAEQIKAAALLARAREGLDLVVVDSLGRLRRPAGEATRLVLGAMTNTLKDLALSADVPVLLVHHVSRAPINDNRPPRMTDLRESGEIEQWADNVWLLWRPEQWLNESDERWAEEKGKAYLLVHKNRAGQTGTIQLAWLGEHVAFRDLDWRHGAQ